MASSNESCTITSSRRTSSTDITTIYGSTLVEDRDEKIGIAHGSPTQDQLDFNEKHGIGIAVGSPPQSQLGAEEFSIRRSDARQASAPRGVHRAWVQVFAAFFLFMNSWYLLL
jgi:hypothetical protein